MKEEKVKTKDEIELPSEITEPIISNPRDLIILSIPKMGKGTILGDFTRKYNAIVLDLEKTGYDYIAARKLSTYTSQETSKWESFQNYIKYRNLLLENKNKYEYLIIDGLTDLDSLAEIGGTLLYMNSIMGKKFNRVGNDSMGEKLSYDDPDWKSVISLPEGAGYQHTRTWFLQQFDIFRQISPYRIYAAHIADKYIKDNGKDEVIGAEILLTGKLKNIIASKVTTMGKLIADGNDRYINFDVLNDSIIAGSRAPYLKGKILISKMDKNDKLTTFWENIYR